VTQVTDLQFRFDWDSVGESVRSPELRATWARLEVWVGDTCATLAEDLSTRSPRRSITVSLYPLAEWIAFNWWLIRFDARDGEPEYRARRRNFRSAGDGFIWPRIELVPAGLVSLVRWSPAAPVRGDTLRYLSHGQQWVETAQLRESLGELVQAVVARLGELGIEDTALQKEWSSLAALDDEQAEFCEAAARLGLDPFSEGVDLAESIDQAFGGLSPNLREEFLDAVPPETIEPTLAVLRESLDQARRHHVARKGQFEPELVIEAVRDAGELQPGMTPWAVGYSAARTLRAQLKLPSTGTLSGLPVNVAAKEANVPEFTGVGTRLNGDELVSLVLLRPMREANQRFAMSRALWHATTTKDSGGYLLTSARTGTQQAGRAFAAELLAPASGIRELLAVDPRGAAPEDLAAVAEHFQVSGMVVGHQVQNQLLDT
jgi:hypothetical protein